MRITSVTLRNCRLHRELKVDFDASRTLIGGPNETGKSTLIEAIHRALFLKAKGNTEHHRALNSMLHLGHPEVELAFEANGDVYLLKKRFGSSGTTTLAPSKSVMLSGDAAETELARLLSAEAGLSGKALASQWAHLWVWQGQAGDDPSAHATARCGKLLQRLQEVGGAAALQSELDARVAKHFAEENTQIYTQAGRPKAGSDLEQAERDIIIAREQLAHAGDRVQMLESSAKNLEDASRDLETASGSLSDLEKQKEETESKVRRLTELRQTEVEQFHAAKEAEDRHGALKSADRQILGARADISKLDENLKPQTEAVVLLEKLRDETKGKAATAEKDFGAATEAVRTVRLHRDLASARVQLFEKTEVHTKLVERVKKVSERKGALAALEEEVAKLPKVDKAELKKIQEFDAECTKARAALQAMATGFEVIATDQPVVAGSRAINVGESQILTEDTDVSIGSAICIRIQPGGGTSLADARQAEEETRRNLREMLDSLGLQSAQEAADFFAQRGDLGSLIKTAKAELKAMGADDLAEELKNAQNDVAAAKATVARLTALVPDENIPDDQAAAKALAKTLEGKLNEAEALEAEKKAVRDQTAIALESVSDTLKDKKAEAEKQGKTLAGLKGQLDLLLKTHGDDAARATALIGSESTKTTKIGALKETTDAIAALQPDMLESDLTRISRAINVRTSERETARTNIAVARAALHSDGSEDPQAALATADAKGRSATERLDSVRRKAQAVVLLDKLFEEEQRTLSEQFTHPLADKISGYLQCIFGVGARAQVELEDNEFRGLRLFRPGFGSSPFAFDKLSGGAKEQTAAAVRLAMAEVLAADHGGCLPVVFDDAFAYSDPERVKQLQRMLDLAALRGLQVIILTCNPADYASLGAKTVAIRVEIYVAPAPSDPVPESGVEFAKPISLGAAGQRPESATVAPVTDQQCAGFLSTLREVGGKSGNYALRQNLGWDEPSYEAVKYRLVEAGKLTTGRGRGGSVSLASIPT